MTIRLTPRRRLQRSLVRSSLVTACALLALPAQTGAHSLQVAPPGPVRLDLGTLAQPRLMHATLTTARDDVVATATMRAGTTYEISVYIPDATPDRAAAGDELPMAQLRLGSESTTVPILDRHTSVTDETTGVRYRRIAQLSTIAEPTSAGATTVPASIRVSMGSVPIRVALLVAPAGLEPSFAAQDVETIPQTLLSLRAWSVTSAPRPGSRATRSSSEGDGGIGALIWIPLLVGVGSLLVAAWWIRSGWSTARERGSRTSTEE